MVAISPPAKVLVTGANGYLATWVLKKYLEAGYSVRGTVRSLSKSAFLNDKFAHYGDRFEIIVVEDITKDGAFDEAVKGVDTIAHTASPFHYKSTHPDDLIIPAVRGTTSILNSALKHGSTLKRVILTSSVAAVREHTTVPRVFNESNWNDAAVERLKTKGSGAGPSTIYLASKTLAEKAAWEFVAAHRPEILWDLVVINPPLVFGPSLSPAPTVDDINTSQREIYDTLTGARTSAQLQAQGNWVHVSVASVAHVRATHAVGAGGQRIIVQSGPFFFQDLLDSAAELGIPNVPRGEPGSTKGISFIINLETKKAEELLGLTTATPLKDAVAESVEDFKARGYPGFTA
ncbi:D-lactaldehyde dehydrogenase [Russula ochroleuca]|uniref:D-lactaldehyde dehydrogenase n=1 Tax=Russula ochroleuca TaxID=152965 RepID=A0A9P5JWY0_9AGAM|nr:D-lactaldehyde dehydrogenase [Russula ochroleuca]